MCRSSPTATPPGYALCIPSTDFEELADLARICFSQRAWASAPHVEKSTLS